MKKSSLVIIICVEIFGLFLFQPAMAILDSSDHFPQTSSHKNSSNRDTASVGDEPSSRRSINEQLDLLIDTYPDQPRSKRPTIKKQINALIERLETNIRARYESHERWSPQGLKDILQQELAGDEVLVVSNREPIEHNKIQGEIKMKVPASGVVTALEPVVLACAGTWIAHGSGSADREVVDEHDRVTVRSSLPESDDTYQLRRVWLSQEEVSGFYEGFSNQALWPLCHNVYEPPNFRNEDFTQYRQVNQKFADVVVNEAKTDDPLILIQDYQFALLPQMIREKLPNATIVLFWHIPWPNVDAFERCPYRSEILRGMLASNIVGFQTPDFCTNFLNSVDKNLESNIDRGLSQVKFQDRLTDIKSYPISIEFPLKGLEKQRPISECRDHIREVNQLPKDQYLGVGVDRLDPIKGIPARLQAVEKFLDIHPEWLGRFTFIQIAAPSREMLQRYQMLNTMVCAETTRINDKFIEEYKKAHPEEKVQIQPPILLKVEYHTPNQVLEYYRASDLCLVSSLEDGMNLVAKEFVAARDDERGVLLLSKYAGASKELNDALIIDPLDKNECAQNIHRALQMPDNEQELRMQTMRKTVQENNIYRWAASILNDAARSRRRRKIANAVQSENAAGSCPSGLLPSSPKSPLDHSALSG